MKLVWVVEWVPIDDSFIVAICTEEKTAREIFESFTAPDDGYGWLYINQYALNQALSVELPLEVASKRFK
jgi:hypothetical protein